MAVSTVSLPQMFLRGGGVSSKNMKELCVLEGLCLFSVILEGQGIMCSPVDWASALSEFTYMQEPRSVTTGENDNGRRGTLSSRRNMFLCFIISDQIAVPKKKQKYFLRDTFIIASFDFLSASSKVIWSALYGWD